MAKDKDYIKLINTMRWQLLRRDILTEHPLCERCEKEGRITPAKEVHHRRPVYSWLTYPEKEKLMYDPSNLCALCHECHVTVHKELGKNSRKAMRRLNDERRDTFVKKYFSD